MLSSRLFATAAVVVLSPLAALAQTSGGTAPLATGAIATAPFATAPAPAAPTATAPIATAPAAAAPVAASPAAASPPAASPAAPPAATAMTATTPHLVANGNMISTLKASADFTILTKALDATNMSGVLAATPGLTLFAPTDEAFRALPSAQLAALLEPKNAPVLQQVLTYHLVHLDLDTSKFKGARGPVQSVERGNLQLDGSGAVPRVNNADIIEADVRASNGVIHVVNRVLIPTDVSLPTASASIDTPASAGR
jgi:uncharacterized surface protein with fasciclin (FAS1) repeats